MLAAWLLEKTSSLLTKTSPLSFHQLLTTVSTSAVLGDEIGLAALRESLLQSTSSYGNYSRSSVDLVISFPRPLISFLSPGFRRFSRLSKLPDTCWLAKPSSSTVRIAEVLLIANDIHFSCSEGMSSRNKEFRFPGIRKEEDVVCESGTLELVERTPARHLISCGYVLCIKSPAGPEVCSVAKAF